MNPNQTDPADQITIAEVLPMGVLYQGQRHRHFTLRPATLADSMATIVEIGTGPDATLASSTETAQRLIAEFNTRRNLAILARQLTQLGGIPLTEINLALLMQAMPPEDFDVLWMAGEELKKKWQALPQHGATGHSSSNSSGSEQASPQPN